MAVAVQVTPGAMRTTSLSAHTPFTVVADVTTISGTNLVDRRMGRPTQCHAAKSHEHIRASDDGAAYLAHIDDEVIGEQLAPLQPKSLASRCLQYRAFSCVIGSISIR